MPGIDTRDDAIKGGDGRNRNSLIWIYTCRITAAMQEYMDLGGKLKIKVICTLQAYKWL